MHLKALTLRGFKSFASSTTLHFEPGITCVVGPNGSGKSNVVDALAWVMGEQGAKSLRGGSMADVIFAGTPGRPALGRAEVVLTIDNADRALPLDAAEVTISRTLFRNGSSEYAINSQPCRLLDVTELLADSGIGREMHVIVGQGQLDTLLNATPEVRRGLVEEAAGVLKHRKRKEKALRKLDATAATMARLNDLTAELRRQLTPLARQAEAARRAASVQAEVRDARLRLLADDAVRLDAELLRDQAIHVELTARRAELDRRLAELTELAAAIDESDRTYGAQTQAQNRLVSDLAALLARIEGTQALAQERSTRLGASRAHSSGPDPAALEAEVVSTQADVDALRAEVEDAEQRLADAVRARQAAEDASAAAGRLAEDRRAEQTRRRDEAAGLASTLEGARSALSASLEEQSRLLRARDEAVARARRSRADFHALEARVGGLTAGEEELDAEHAAAEAELSEAEALLAAATDSERRAERERAAASSRIDALTLALGRPDATGALLADPDTSAALLGSLAAALAIEPGAQTAVAAALGGLADAAVVDGVDRAVDLLAGAAAAQLGRTVLLVAGGEDGAGGAVQPDDGWPRLPPGLRYLVDAVAAAPRLHPAVRAVIGPTVLARDIPEARAVIDALGDVVAVTPDGTVLSRHVAVGGPAGGSRVEIHAELEQASERLQAADNDVAQARFARARHEARRAEVVRRRDDALSVLHDSDAALAAVAERLGHLGHEMRAAEAESHRLAQSAEAVDERITAESERLADLQERFRQARARVDELEAADTKPIGANDLAALDRTVHTARQAEVSARLELRTLEERLRTAASRVDTLTRQAATIRADQERAVRRHEREQRQAVLAAWVAEQTTALRDRAAQALGAAQAERDRQDERDATRRAQRREIVHETSNSRQELERVVAHLHRDEIALAELRLRVSSTRERALQDWGVGVGELVDEYGPHLPVPSADPASPPTPYVREEQERRAERAERALERLGRVNPLALEEHAAAQERLTYLSGQLEDLERTRRDLLGIVREIDDRVEVVFAEAFADTAREFEGVFARLFPGGEGRLVLTEPDDLLATGIEVEARPAGKRVKRLSLLSGGERALVAVTFLVALFRARPSPFYVLDEVEAALDDVNLGRLLDLYEELRETSQLLVVTHQKRTMEIADSLYGVSMRADGVSTVISQRLREPQAV